MTRSSGPKTSGNGPGGNRGLIALVAILGGGITLAVLFVAVAFLVRALSGPEPTPVATRTLVPTYTSVAALATDTPGAEIPATDTPTSGTAGAETPGAETPVAETPGAETTTEASSEATATQAAAAPTATKVLPTNTPIVQTATPSPTSPPSGKPAQMSSPDYGIQAFLWWHPEVADRDLGLIRDAGFTWVKQWFAWRDIEGKGRGQYDWSTADRIVQQTQEFGLKLIVRVDHQPDWAGPPPGNINDFANFLSTMASRYKGRIQAYQVWNEPNLAREWGNKAPSAGEYTQMLKKAYNAIKAADPNAIVVSAGMAPTTELSQRAVPDTKFIQSMYDAGARPFFDMLGAHGAGYKAPPEMDPGVVANDPNYSNVGDVNCPGPACRIYCFRHVEDLHQIMVNNGDGSKRVVVLEFGWTRDERTDSPYYWHRVEDQFVQGDYMKRAYAYAKANWQPWI
ncbi:MAG: cellulase family glycosylhydrolase, partial [Anaerolineae bacterium]